MIGACARRHRSIEFRAFLDWGERSVPPDLGLHLALDDLKTRLIHDWLIKQLRLHLRFTPTGASWLNLVECWFALLSRRLVRGAFTSAADLEGAILASVARFCRRTSNSGH